MSRQADEGAVGETVVRVRNYLLSFCCEAKLSEELLASVLSERENGSSIRKLLALVLMEKPVSFSRNELLAALPLGIETKT